MNNNTGWICPRCSDVNSPTVKVCGCNSYKNKYVAPFRVPDHIFTPVNPTYPPYTVTSREVENNMFKVQPASVMY